MANTPRENRKPAMGLILGLGLAGFLGALSLISLLSFVLGSMAATFLILGARNPQVGRNVFSTLFRSVPATLLALLFWGALSVAGQMQVETLGSLVGAGGVTNAAFGEAFGVALSGAVAASPSLYALILLTGLVNMLSDLKGRRIFAINYWSRLLVSALIGMGVFGLNDAYGACLWSGCDAGLSADAALGTLKGTYTVALSDLRALATSEGIAALTDIAPLDRAAGALSDSNGDAFRAYEALGGYFRVLSLFAGVGLIFSGIGKIFGRRPVKPA